MTSLETGAERIVRSDIIGRDCPLPDLQTLEASRQLCQQLWPGSISSLSRVSILGLGS